MMHDAMQCNVINFSRKKQKKKRKCFSPKRRLNSINIKSSSSITKVRFNETRQTGIQVNRNYNFAGRGQAQFYTAV